MTAVNDFFSRVASEGANPSLTDAIAELDAELVAQRKETLKRKISLIASEHATHLKTFNAMRKAFAKAEEVIKTQMNEAVELGTKLARPEDADVLHAEIDKHIDAMDRNQRTMRDVTRTIELIRDLTKK